MASPNPTPGPGPEPPLPTTLRVISHTGIVYWWPVWAVGLLLGALTYFGDRSLAVVPAKTEVHKLAADRYELTVPGGSAGRLDAAADNTAAGREAFPHRVSGNESYGLLWVVVLLLVIFGSNVPLRGMASLVALLSILVLVGILAFFDVWPRIFDFLGGLRIDFSTEAFLVPSIALLIIWLATVFLYDRLRYMTFTPGQFVLHKDIGDLRQVYDTTQITVEKRRTDYFRHWILGLGAGDIIIKVPGQNVIIEFPNVLFVDKRLREIADLMKTKPVIPQ